MLETVGQFGLQYREQAQVTLGSLVATPSLLSRVIESQGQDAEIVSIRDRVQSYTGDEGWCSDPRARPDWRVRTETPGTLNLFLLFFVLLNFLFQKCRDPNPRPDLNGGSEPEPGLLRCFQLSCQNIFFILFLFRFSICAEAFSNGSPTNIYISQNTIIVEAFYALSK